MNWYEDEVRRVEQERSQTPYHPETIFYGSSSFTLWRSLYEDFEVVKPVNLGFGGSTIAACCWFFSRIIDPLPTPKRILLYAGDNDLGDGRHPEEVYLFYKLLASQIRARFGSIPSYYISIKPSLQRWEIIGNIRTANRLIREETESHADQHYVDIYQHMFTSQGLPDKTLFEEDGLHLSPKGYALWTRIIMDSVRI